MRRVGPDDKTPPVTEPPGGLPGDWLEQVNRPQSEEELAALARSIGRGVPFGRESWVKRFVADHGLESTLRPRGRPRKR